MLNQYKVNEICNRVQNFPTHLYEYMTDVHSIPEGENYVKHVCTKN